MPVKLSRFALIGVIALGTLAGVGVRLASANIINIDLEGYRTGGGGTDTNIPPTTYVGSGAAGGGTVFNGISPTALSDNTNSATTGDNQTYTASALLDSSGTATTVGFSISPIGVDNENPNVGSPSNSTSLFYDYMFNHSAGNNTNATFTISGLTPGATYDVYLYAGFADVGTHLNNTTVTGGTPATLTPTGVFTSSNTLLYVANADNGGNITGTLGAGTQILAGLTVGSVPEPGSLGVLALGALGLLRRRRD